MPCEVAPHAYCRSLRLAASGRNPRAPAENSAAGQPADNGNGGGVTLAFRDCQTQTGLAGDRVLLGTFFAINLTDEHKLVVRAHDAPSNATLTCPSVLLCDAPAYTQVCLTLKKGDSALGGQDPKAFISAVNATSTAGTSCGFVATETSSWSTIKGLFR